MIFTLIRDEPKNVAHLAKFVKLELFANKIFGTLLNPDYSYHFNNHRSNKISYKKIIIRLYRNINPLIARKPFIMKHVTRIKLDRFYYEQNKGLDELLNRNVSKLWYHFLQDRT